MCQANVYLHITKRNMIYDPGKIVTHGCKLHVEA